MKMEYKFTAHLEDISNPKANIDLTEDRTIAFKFEVTEEEAKKLMAYSAEGINFLEDVPQEIKPLFYRVWNIAESLLFLSEGMDGYVHEGEPHPIASYEYMHGKYRIIKTRTAIAA